MVSSAAAAKVIDAFAFLFDHPDRRDISLVDADINYTGMDFSKEIYEKSRGKRFSTFEDAYRDWVEFGRGEGLRYHEAKDTLLKILVKVKDEADFIEHWIEYHSAIVGYHNIIVLDCGSTEPRFIEILDRYKRKIMIFQYKQYYDDVHWHHANTELFSALSKNCKYLTIIDADEFLFGYLDGKLSSKGVIDVLQRGKEKIYAATWFFNADEMREKNGALDWSNPMRFHLDRWALELGTNAGKVVMLSRMASESKYIGHNLHVREVVSFLNSRVVW